MTNQRVDWKTYLRNEYQSTAIYFVAHLFAIIDVGELLQTCENFIWGRKLLILWYTKISGAWNIENSHLHSFKVVYWSESNQWLAIWPHSDLIHVPEMFAIYIFAIPLDQLFRYESNIIINIHVSFVDIYNNMHSDMHTPWYTHIN